MIKHKRRFPWSPSRLRSGDLLTIAGSAVFMLAIAGMIGFMLSTRITTEEGMYTVNREDKEFSMPFKLSGAPAGNIIVRFILDLPPNHPTSFHIIPDDCLQALDINGRQVEHESLPLCDFTNGAVFDLSPYLRKGHNAVVARISNVGGDAQFVFQPTWSDSSLFLSWGVLLGLVISFVIFLLLRFKPALWIITITILFLMAAFVRGYYLLSTPYWVRGHDTDGHIQYIEYIADNGRLPSPNEGWEYWQPPLYYVFGAVWAKSAETMGLTRGDMLFGVQVLSYLLSLAMLGCVLWAGYRLFPEPKERSIALPLFFALVAFSPGLIYLSARINNDVLAVAWAFFAACALLEWWRTGSRQWWGVLILAISLHIITKNNGLLLLPVAYFCLLIRRGISWKRTIADGVLGLMIVGVVAGWFSVYRMTQDSSQDLIIGNTDTLNSGLNVENNFAAYTVFNPIEMIKIPYNNPWEDEARRNFFWEYWYRSAFFGEFDFGDSRKLIASWVLGWSFIVLLIAFAGLLRSLRGRFYQYLPILVLGAALTLGHAAFRFRYPYGSSQDFRYSLLLLLPWALCATLGIVLYRSPLWKKTATYAVHAFIAFCIAFLLHP